MILKIKQFLLYHLFKWLFRNDNSYWVILDDGDAAFVIDGIVVSSYKEAKEFCIYAPFQEYLGDIHGTYRPITKRELNFYNEIQQDMGDPVMQISVQADHLIKLLTVARKHAVLLRVEGRPLDYAKPTDMVTVSAFTEGGAYILKEVFVDEYHVPLILSEVRV